VAFAGLGVYAAWLAVRGMFVVDFGTEPWWIEVLRGHPGRTYPLDGRTTTAINLENVRSLFISRDGEVVNRLTLGYWRPRQVRELIDALRAHGVELDGNWDGEYPPWTS
jgi:hypothetical protein